MAVTTPREALFSRRNSGNNNNNGDDDDGSRRVSTSDVGKIVGAGSAPTEAAAKQVLQPLRAGYDNISIQRRSFTSVGPPAMSRCQNDGDMVCQTAFRGDAGRI